MQGDSVGSGRSGDDNEEVKRRDAGLSDEEDDTDYATVETEEDLNDAAEEAGLPGATADTVSKAQGGAEGMPQGGDDKNEEGAEVLQGAVLSSEEQDVSTTVDTVMAWTFPSVLGATEEPCKPAAEQVLEEGQESLNAVAGALIVYDPMALETKPIFEVMQAVDDGEEDEPSPLVCRSGRKDGQSVGDLGRMKDVPKAAPLTTTQAPTVEVDEGFVAEQSQQQLDPTSVLPATVAAEEVPPFTVVFGLEAVGDAREGDLVPQMADVKQAPNQQRKKKTKKTLPPRRKAKPRNRRAAPSRKSPFVSGGRASKRRKVEAAPEPPTDVQCSGSFQVWYDSPK